MVYTKGSTGEAVNCLVENLKMQRRISRGLIRVWHETFIFVIQAISHILASRLNFGLIKIALQNEGGSMRARSFG